MIRRRRNKIIYLQNDNGDWVTDNATLENMATTFFLNLYTDSPTHTPFILKNMFPTLSSSDNIMAQNVTDDEVKDVIFGMGSWKAPGRDGLQAIWNKVGTDVCELTRNIFQEPNKIREVNEMLITLIPKVEPVSHLKQLRPFSLCNLSVHFCALHQKIIPTH
ncbi:hypothetical protein AHAS_Ahas13G0369400 [Arachis hypogaea]